MASILPQKVNFKFKIAALAIIVFNFSSVPAFANSIYNRSPWPPAYQNLEVVKENTDFQDAAHPCHRTHGRSFQVTHNDSFKLSGLSIYVYVPGEPTKFDRSLFRLSFSDPSSKLLVTGTSPTHAAAIALDNGGNTTFEVFFPLNVNINGGASHTAVLECLTDDTESFRVIESSRIDDGLTQYYDSNASQTSPYYMTGRKVLFTSFSERNAPHFPALATVNSQLPALSLSNGSTTPPKFHPVIFVHGLGGDPSNFESDSENRNYVKLLTDLGYPRDYIHLYSYGYKYNNLKRVNEYNYQGDVKEIAQGLEVVVNSLSDRHKADGGDGRVDIVGHSLGTLVTRYYLKTHADHHKIRRFIAVGAPFKGTWVMALDKNIRAFPVLGKTVEKLLADSIIDIYNKENPNPISRDSVASIQATPGSDFLEGPNGINKTNINNLEFYSIYGNINASIRQKIFTKTFEKKLDLGDGLILEDSATYSGWVSNSKKFAYNDGLILDFKANQSNGVLAAQFKVANPKSLKTLHAELLTRTDSKSKIVCLVSKENTGDCN